VRKDARIELLQNVWLFERCSRKELALLAANTTLVTAPAGTLLAREGEIGREFFVIISGKAEVSRSGTNLRVLGVGEFFGEMALIDRRPRTASVTASADCELLVLAADEFSTVVESMPSVDRKMLGVLVERLRQVEEEYVPPGKRSLSEAV